MRRNLPRKRYIHLPYNIFSVCYREADAGAQPEGEDEAAGGGNQLAAFMDQLQEEGRLEGDVQEVLQQVAQQAPAQPPVSDVSGL